VQAQAATERLHAVDQADQPRAGADAGAAGPVVIDLDAQAVLVGGQGKVHDGGTGVLLGNRVLRQGEEVDEGLAQCSRAGLSGAELGEHPEEPGSHLLVVVADAGQDVGQRALDAAEAKVRPVGHRSACRFTGTVRAGQGTEVLDDLIARSRWCVSDRDTGAVPLVVDGVDPEQTVLAQPVAVERPQIARPSPVARLLFVHVGRRVALDEPVHAEVVLAVPKARP
jgi:hypothetical protein